MSRQWRTLASDDLGSGAARRCVSAGRAEWRHRGWRLGDRAGPRHRKRRRQSIEPERHHQLEYVQYRRRARRRKSLMPNSSSTELDRVTGGLGPSQILGSLYSNGKVFLVNPDGILFGQGRGINVGSLLATTNDISNSDFMAGRYNFNIPAIRRPRSSTRDRSRRRPAASPRWWRRACAIPAPSRQSSAPSRSLPAMLSRSTSMATISSRWASTTSIASQVIDVSTGQPLSSLVSNDGQAQGQWRHR